MGRYQNADAAQESGERSEYFQSRRNELSLLALPHPQSDSVGPHKHHEKGSKQNGADDVLTGDVSRGGSWTGGCRDNSSRKEQ